MSMVGKAHVIDGDLERALKTAKDEALAIFFEVGCTFVGAWAPLFAGLACRLCGCGSALVFLLPIV